MAPKKAKAKATKKGQEKPAAPPKEDKAAAPQEDKPPAAAPEAQPEAKVEGAGEGAKATDKEVPEVPAAVPEAPAADKVPATDEAAPGEAAAEEGAKAEADEPMPDAKPAEAPDAAAADVEMRDAAGGDDKKKPPVMEPPPRPDPMSEDHQMSGPVEELDAVPDSRPKAPAGSVYLNFGEATPNVMPAADGRLLLTLCDGGFQYMNAGVRANACVKAGRYMFEVKIIEMLSPYEGNTQRQYRTPMPRQLVRLGFSLATSATPLLDDGLDKAYFDSEGNFCHRKTRTRAAPRLQREQVIAVMLNLDASTPNANTMSLFCDGRRISEPQRLPESLVGKPLCPSISYKNVTLQVNLGPHPKKQLPFKCRMLRDAAAEDLEIPAAAAPADGKREVLFPIALPDHGFHDWVDQFLEGSPRHFEMSDRKILRWAQQSGLSRPKGYNWRSSNDKPGFNFGLPMMDDGSIPRGCAAVAPALGRDLVIAELRGNFLASEREKMLGQYPAADFKRVAVVLMGEPPADYKAKVQELMLKDKVVRAARETQRRAEEKRRGAREAGAEEQRRGYEAPSREEDGEEDAGMERGDEGEQPDDAGAKEGKAPTDGGADTPEGEPATEEKAEKEEPVELTAEEKAMWHRALQAPDLAPSALSKSFASFSLPGADEGFDEVRYVWQGPEKCQEVLKEWILERKKTQRVEDLEPSAWFKEKLAEWQKVLNKWKTEAKEAQRRRPFNPTRKEPAKRQEKGGGGGDEEPRKDPEDGEERADEEKEEENKEKDEKAEEAKPAEFDEDDVDVFTVEDIYDIGNGKPLFAHFVYEDWTLLSLRYELHLLVHAFRHDLADPDRQGFHQSHLAFYYNKYYHKGFNVKYFGCETLDDLVQMIKDTIAVNAETLFVETKLPLEEPFDKFLRWTEEHRRERQRCIDAGDETANLKFTRPSEPPHSSISGQHRGGGGGHGGGGRDYYQRPSGSGHSRGPPPSQHMGNNGPPRGSYGGGGMGGDRSGSRGGYGAPAGPAPPSRMGYAGEPVGSHGQKRPFVMPPPPATPFPPPASNKHQRYSSSGPSSRGGGGYPAPGSGPPRGGYGGGGHSGGRSNYR